MTLSCVWTITVGLDSNILQIFWKSHVYVLSVTWIALSFTFFCSRPSTSVFIVFVYFGSLGLRSLKHTVDQMNKLVWYQYRHCIRNSMHVKCNRMMPRKEQAMFIRRIGRGGAMGANASSPPPPPPHTHTARKGPPGRIQRWTYEKEKERQRWIFSSQFVNARSSSQCRKLTRGCWSLKTVFMILIYLPRPVSNHNTIMRKGRLAVVFLGSIFPKSLKMRSQVKSLLTEPLYLLTLRLFDIFSYF